MWHKEKFFKYSLGILLVLLIIFMVGQVDFFLIPFKRFAASLFIPLLVSGLLYYLLRPLVNLVQKLRVPRSISIVIVFLIVILLIGIISANAGSIIVTQLNQFLIELPKLYTQASDTIVELSKNESLNFILKGNIEQQITSNIQKVIPTLSNGIWGVLSTLTSTLTIVIVIPFILFYLLRDDGMFSTRILTLIPVKYREDVKKTFEDIDKTLSTYIIGQMILALILGLLMYIGYLIIGLKFALALAVFAAITFFIPLFGAVIGVIPAIFVSLADNPATIIKVVVLMLIVQQLEGNLVSPQLIGKRMEIHPLTIILIFIVAASLYGFIGMLIAVPTYAVAKVVIGNAIKIYKLSRPPKVEEQE